MLAIIFGTFVFVYEVCLLKSGTRRSLIITHDKAFGCGTLVVYYQFQFVLIFHTSDVVFNHVVQYSFVGFIRGRKLISVIDFVSFCFATILLGTIGVIGRTFVCGIWGGASEFRIKILIEDI